MPDEEISQAIVPAPEQPAPVKNKGGRPKGVSKKALRRELEKQILKEAPDLMKKALAALGRNADRDEKWAVENILETLGAKKGPGGLTLVQAIQNNTIQRDSEGGKTRSFESIIRKLETEAEMSAPLAQPDESEDDVEDAEFEDVE